MSYENICIEKKVVQAVRSELFLLYRTVLVDKRKWLV